VPLRWQSKRRVLDLKTPFNFVSTNDIVGGNSSSPAINRRSELIGLIFHAKIQSLVGNFEYEESVNR
jgi:V8-like Glu-specific endopeptidase